MRDRKGNCRHPFDEWLGLRKYQRHSSLVEVKVAEMASETDYREVARVGEAQAQADQEMVTELEEAACLPEGKHVPFLYAESDGVFVRGTKL